MKKILFLAVALLAGGTGWGQGIFNKYAPVAGIQKSTGLDYHNTVATITDIQSLLSASPGVVLGGATGGAQGVGTINATALYINGAPVGTSSGAVSSVGLTVPTCFGVTGSPVTSAGSLGLTLTGSPSNFVRANGTCATGILAADIQALTPTWSALNTFAAGVDVSAGGFEVGSATGGNLGTGTINVASSISVNNVPVSIDIPQTSYEAAVSVVPTNISFSPCNVYRYGATGNGTTDDTTAIQHAFTACTNRTVNIPNGTYLHTGLTLSTGLRVIGESRSGVVFTYAGTGVAIDGFGLDDLWLESFSSKTTNIAATGMKFGNGSQHIGLYNIALSSTAATGNTGTGLLLDAGAPGVFSGNFQASLFYVLGYKFGTKVTGAGGVNTWTSMSFGQTYLLGNSGAIITGSIGLYFDSNTNGVGSSFIGGSVEGFATGVQVDNGGTGLEYVADIEGDTTSYTVGSSFTGRIKNTNGGEDYNTGNTTINAEGAAVALTLNGASNMPSLTVGAASGRIQFLDSGSSDRSILTDGTNASTNTLTIQAGAGSTGYGGGLVLYAAANATNAGGVWIGTASGSGAINFGAGGTGPGTTYMSIAHSGAVTINAPSAGTPLTVNGAGTSSVGAIVAMGGPLEAAQASAPQVILNSSGANFGLIQNPSSGVWSLAHGTVANSLGTDDLLWSTTGVKVGAPTGGFEGAGTLNATGLYINGTAVCQSTGTNCPAAAALKVAAGTMTSSGGGCTINQNTGSSIGGCTRTGTGVLQVTATGFSSGSCTVSPAADTYSANAVGAMSGNTQVVNLDTFAGAATDGQFSIVCIGN